MVDLKSLLEKEKVFLYEFKNEKSVFDEFRLDEEDCKFLNILFASYGCENYSGDAFVLFEKEGKFYEVNGSHCSCHGLEEQWLPEEVVFEELEHRLKKGFFGTDDFSGNVFKDKLISFLEIN